MTTIATKIFKSVITTSDAKRLCKDSLKSHCLHQKKNRIIHPLLLFSNNISLISNAISSNFLKSKLDLHSANCSKQSKCMCDPKTKETSPEGPDFCQQSLNKTTLYRILTNLFVKSI